MTHNYDPSWDYDLDPRPHPETARHVATILARYTDLWAAMKLAAPRVYFVRRLKPHLARYVNGTTSQPVIVVDAAAHVRSARRYGVDLYDAVLGTLLHEVGHAYVETTGLELDSDTEEEIVERFAHTTWEHGAWDLAFEDFDQALQQIADETET